MREGITVGMALPAAVDEIVLVLCCQNTVHHDSQVPAGGVLHTDRALNCAGSQSVLLVLHAAGADRHIAQKVVQIFVVLRIEHLVRAYKSCLLHRAHVQFACSDDPLKEIGLRVGIRLVDQPLVAFAGRPGLVRVNAGDNEDLVLHLFPQRHKPGYIVNNALLIVSRAGPDDQG